MKFSKIAGCMMAAVMTVSSMAAIPSDNGESYVISASAATKNKDIVKGVLTVKNVNCIDKAEYQDNLDIKKVVIECDLDYIGADAFYGCKNLTEVVIKGNVSSGIGEYAFSGCYKLKSFVFEKSDAYVETIGSGAFYFDPNLTKVTLPSNLKSIEKDAFLNCNRLEKIRIPSKTTIGKNAIGYVYWTESKTYEIANGKQAMVITYADGSTDNLTARIVTMEVVKGSKAEQYAKDNGIKYKNYTASSNGSSSNAKLTTPKNFSATSTENSITLTWKAVAGAEKYNVYMFNPEKGAYVLYKTTKSSKITVKGLDSDTKYKFMVAAVKTENGKSVVGPKSKALSVTTL